MYGLRQQIGDQKRLLQVASAGAPDFINRPFGEIFDWTLAPLTPLLAQSDEQPDDDADGN